MSSTFELRPSARFHTYHDIRKPGNMREGSLALLLLSRLNDCVKMRREEGKEEGEPERERRVQWERGEGARTSRESCERFLRLS